MAAERFVPIVCGADILGYSYVRSFADIYDVTSQVYATADIKTVSSSRFCFYSCVKGIDQEAQCLAELKRKAPELKRAEKQGLLLGSGDWYARIFSAHKEELEDLGYIVPYNDFSLIDYITNKRNFYDLCDKLGMAHPKTAYIDCKVKKMPSFDEFRFPVVIKPANSAAWHYADIPDKEKVYEIQTKPEAERLIQQVFASDFSGELIMQDFIPGADDHLYSLTVFMGDKGEPLLQSMGRVVLQDHAPSALGNPVSIIDDYKQDLLGEATKLLRELGYKGYANFDVKYDARDGSYKFFEVNTRPGRNSYYDTLSGIPFIEPIVDFYVHGNSRAYGRGTSPFLFTCVPHSLIKRYVQDEKLLERIEDRYREGLAAYPLYNKKDTLGHNFWSALTLYNQKRKFTKYYGILA